MIGEKFSTAQVESFRSLIADYTLEKSLPKEAALVSLIDEAITCLENESPSYRPRSQEKKVGGLLDFTHLEQKPVILVPDIHARFEFLPALLSSHILKSSSLDVTVLEALCMDAVRIVCVGDVWHTENASWGYERWRNAYEDWMNGKVAGPDMVEEMKENFKAVRTVMALKKAFPSAFHFLKGNHENILNTEGGGDHGFLKFAMEGEMVRDFIKEVYGDVCLHLLSCFEKALPIVALFPTFGVSHAEPKSAYKREGIINYHSYPDLILSFTWTANDEARKGSVVRQLQELVPSLPAKDALWFAGHRPVPEKYLLRQEGALVQFHNPDEMNVVLIDPKRKFNVETDIKPILKN